MLILPLIIKILFAILAVQVILLVVLKKRKRLIVFFTLIPVIAITVWQGLYEYNRTNKDLSKVKPDVKISVTNLISEYETNDSLANLKYLGKILELNGTVKKIEGDGSGDRSVIMGEMGSLSSVRCTMDTMYKSDAAGIQEGSSVIIRGACTGFKKNELLGENLGSDVELNRCVFVKQ